ncbi:LiaI-LiaF-like domain-containing protein [Prevotella sp. 10(H)]|uniref:LiaI-LiaF-like domain-containing protein n=1 Tax=Prevotella sp. 10(H) TaxID=1158294 RepID=UPI0004A70A84|nr:DUF5668 domain-containing protein [Prevotella sp. 10(H)]
MEKDFKDKHLFKRGRDNGSGFAILLIFIGGLFLLFNLNIISAEYRPILLSWQMLLIGIGVWSLLKRNYSAAIILIAVGGFFIYPRLCHILPEYFTCVDIDFKTYWPVLLIIVGACLVLSRIIPSSRKRNEHDHPYEQIDYAHRSKSANSENNSSDYNEAAYVDKNVMFGSAEQIVLSRNFKGGEGNVMFGELIIDLRRAQLSDMPGVLEANVMFGSIVIYIPSDWDVELKSNSILGSFEDKRYRSGNIAEGSPCLIIKGSAMFGSGEIRN